MNRETVLLRSALSSLCEGVAIVDRRGQLLFFNDTARRFFDSRLMKHRPQRWSKSFGLYLPDMKTPFPLDELPLIRAMRGEEINDSEMYIRNANMPEGAWINVNARPIRDGKKRILGGISVFLDITERKKAEQEIVEISGREQRRIGQDLHDGLCQTLLASQFSSRVLKEKLRLKRTDQALDCLGEIQSQLSLSLAQADVIARGLYPVELEARGLSSALMELAYNYSRIYRVQVQLRGSRSLRVSDPVVANHLYRIAQEAVSNAIKGGKAQKVVLQLAQTPRRLHLTVTDDGRGISPDKCRNGMGMTLMAYRARIIGARLTFQRQKPGGTQMSCLVGGSAS